MLFADAEETADAEHDRNDAAVLVEYEIFDIAELVGALAAGVIDGRADDAGDQPVAVGAGVAGADVEGYDIMVGGFRRGRGRRGHFGGNGLRHRGRRGFCLRGLHF